MQFTHAAVLAILASAVSAQTIASLLGQIPSCALTCLTPAITASGCGLTDYVCQCTTGHDTILAKSAPCIQSGCSTSDALTTTTVTNQICAIAEASGSSAASTPASTPASSVASSAASVASSAASVASSASSVASSAASVASSTGSVVSSLASSIASSLASSMASTMTAGTTSIASAGSSATSAAAATTSKSSGDNVRVGAGMVGAAILAAIAL